MTHTINVPLAEKVLAQIMAAPKRWTQTAWLNRPYAPEEQAPENTVDNCKTSGCFAGWAVVLGGRTTHQVTGHILNPDPALLPRVDAIYPYLADIYSPSERLSVRSVAAADLGLDDDQAERLFEASNTLSDLYEYLEAWTDGEITPPADLPAWANLGPDELDDYFSPENEADDAFGGEG